MGEFLRPGEKEVMGGERFEEGATGVPADTGESLAFRRYDQGDMNPTDGLNRAELLAGQQAAIDTEQHTEDAAKEAKETNQRLERVENEMGEMREGQEEQRTEAA